MAETKKDEFSVKDTPKIRQQIKDRKNKDHLIVPQYKKFQKKVKLGHGTDLIIIHFGINLNHNLFYYFELQIYE